MPDLERRSEAWAEALKKSRENAISDALEDLESHGRAEGYQGHQYRPGCVVYASGK